MTFKSNYKKSEEFITVLLIILSGFIATAVFKLSNFATFPNLDEMLWHLRSRVFWDKMLEFDFSGLIQSAQPGITVYWFTGFLMRFINFDFTDVTRRIAEKEAEGLDFNSVVNTHDLAIYEIYQPISFAFNAPLFLLTVIFFISFYYLLRKLEFNKIIASFSLLFISNNIFFTYWNTPSDKMLNIFLVLSFLTFLVYLNTNYTFFFRSTRKKLGLLRFFSGKLGLLAHTLSLAEGEQTFVCLRLQQILKFLSRSLFSKKYLILSAVFGAWAALSKLSALFILPFYFVMLVFYVWPPDVRRIKSILKDYFLWLLVFISVCIIFLPTIIFHPGEVYNLFFNPSVFESNFTTKRYFSIITDYVSVFFNVVSLAPAAWIFLAAYIILILSKKYKNRFYTVPLKTMKTINAFILLFVIMVIIVSQNHDTRFMSPVFMLASVPAAVGFYAAMEMAVEKYKIKKAIFYPIATLVFMLSQIFSIVSSGLLMREIIKRIF